MTRRHSMFIIAFGIVAGGSAVQASTITFDGMGYRSNITVLFEGSFRDLRAGQIKADVKGTQYLAYCIDLNQSIKKSWSGEFVSPTMNPRWLAAAYLYDTFASTVDNNTEAAALQVAIWEVVEDFSPLDLAGNVFVLINSTSIRKQAQVYLDALPSDVSGYVPTAAIIRSGPNPQSQDIIIPEPATLAAMVLVLPIMTRRRISAAARLFRA